MGVPAFFRWLSKKYRSVLSDAVELDEDPSNPNPNGVEYDNFYIDMNGLIHPCAHPDDRPAPDSEEEMLENIFAYIDRLMGVVRPRKLLYLSVDGVAPRAKMNQQRSRRFKAAADASELEEAERITREDLLSHGHQLAPEKKHWDSNAITPGTPFMEKVSKGLRYYIANRLTTNPAWKDLNVIFSDSNVPGEGEHKIIDFIRRQRNLPGYNPNTRHCIHGLDADLIMLSLGTHEVKFDLLREQVDFGNKTKTKCAICNQEGHTAAECPNKELQTQGKINFKPCQFLHCGEIRRCILNFYSNIKLPFEKVDDRIIDDFILICSFVGNDFLPHFPTLEIRDGAIELLMSTYYKVLPGLGGYISNSGDINIERMLKVFGELSKMEDGIIYAAKEREKRFQRRKRMEKIEEGFTDECSGIDSSKEPLAKEIVEEMLSIFDKTQREIYAKNPIKLFAPQPHQSDRPEDNGTLPESKQGSSATTATETTNTTIEGSTLTSETEPSDDLPGKKSKRSEDDNANMNAAKQLKLKLSQKHSQNEGHSQLSAEPSSEDTSQLNPEWHEKYYRNKYWVSGDDNRIIPVICYKYVEGICWVMKYYFQGCASWSWYYPFHYAPFATDIYRWVKKDFVFSFDKGKPFTQFAQLMSVLPERSASCVPKVLGELMNERSIIGKFYPEKFPVDKNGKTMPWLAICLLPWIDETKLLKTIEPLFEKLTEHEKKMNTLSDHSLLYVSKNNKLATKIKCFYLPNSETTQNIELDSKQSKEGSTDKQEIPSTEQTNQHQPEEQKSTSTEQTNQEQKEQKQIVIEKVEYDKDTGLLMTESLQMQDFGMAGTIRAFHRHHPLLPGEKYQAPFTCFEPFTSECFICKYNNPTYPEGFKFPSSTLPGAELPKTVPVETYRPIYANDNTAELRALNFETGTNDMLHKRRPYQQNSGRSYVPLPYQPQGSPSARQPWGNREGYDRTNGAAPAHFGRPNEQYRTESASQQRNHYDHHDYHKDHHRDYHHGDTHQQYDRRYYPQQQSQYYQPQGYPQYNPRTPAYPQQESRQLPQQYGNQYASQPAPQQPVMNQFQRAAPSMFSQPVFSQFGQPGLSQQRPPTSIPHGYPQRRPASTQNDPRSRQQRH